LRPEAAEKAESHDSPVAVYQAFFSLKVMFVGALRCIAAERVKESALEMIGQNW
jgi:hypothetical protein